MKIVVDPGHGGSETGAVANGYIEKVLNLKVGLLLQDKLKNCGFEIYMTRETDTNPSLQERGELAKNVNANVLLSIHFNAFDGKAKGVEIIHSFLPACLDSSKWIALKIIKEVVKLGIYERGVWTKESKGNPGRNYYGVLRYAEPIPAVILEGLFLDNPNDIKFLHQDDFLEKLADAYCSGVCEAYGISPIYKDWNDVSDYAKEAVKKLKELGIMTGSTDGRFYPKVNLTREDYATSLYNFIKKFNLK